MWKKQDAKFLWFFLGVGFLLVPFASERMFSPIPIYPLDVVAAGIIVGTLALSFLQRNFFNGVFSLSPAVWMALALFFLGVTISFMAGAPSLTGLGQLKSWFLLPASAAFLLASGTQNQKERDQQFLTALLLGTLALLVATIPYFLFDIRTFDNRFQGPFTHPNFLAFFLAPSVLLSGYFFKGAKTVSLKMFFLIFFLFSLLLLFSTHSFGGWLMAFGGVFWYVFRLFAPLKKGVWVACVSLVFLGIFFTLESFSSNKLETLFHERSSLASRLTIWTVAAQAIKDQPLFGIGAGRFQEVYLSYQPQYPPYLEWAVPQPHNLFLAVWLQTGVLGFLAILFLLWKGLFCFFYQRVTEERAGIEGLFFGTLLYGIFDTPLFGNALAFFFWMLLAFLLFPQKEKPKEPLVPVSQGHFQES